MNDQNNLQRGIYYEPYNYQILEAVQSVGAQVYNTGERIGRMQQNIEEIDKKMSAIPRQPKRKRINRQIACMPDGEIVVVDYFDNNTREVVDSLMNIRGPWAVYQVEVEESDWRVPIFGLHFMGSDIWFFGLTEKLRGKYLFDLFIRQGVRFVCGVSRKSIQDMLYENITGDVFGTENSVQISALPGWKDGKFQYKENFPFGLQEDIKSFPVLTKSFAVLDFMEDTAQKYFQQMRKIKKSDRLVIVVYPFLSILASIFERNGHPVNFGINFIMLSKIRKEKICSLLQIFNRQTFVPISGEISEKSWRNELRRGKDEVVILDCSCDDGVSDYNKKKNMRRLVSAFQTVLEGRQIDGDVSRRFAGGIAAFSDQPLLGRSAYNVFITEDWYSEPENVFVQDRVMERVLSEFCKYVEDNMDIVKELITAKSECEDTRLVTMHIICCILFYFWDSKGFQFIEALGYKEPVNLGNFFQNAECDEEELLQLFIQHFRKNAEQCYFAEKGKGEGSGKTIFYDQEYLFVPINIMDEILNDAAIGRQKYPFLLYLKAKKLLLTDAEGLSKRISICGRRLEMYKICRHTFYIAGKVDIVKLGREE